jgi:hypothetical protein
VPSAAATVDPAPIAKYQLLVASWASNTRFVEAIQELVNNPGVLATDDFSRHGVPHRQVIPALAQRDRRDQAAGLRINVRCRERSGSIDICVTIMVGGTAYVGCATFQPPIVLSGGVV